MNTVAKVMKEAGIRAKVTRRFVDLTDIPTGEGWLFLAVVVDLFSRRIAGGEMAATLTSRLVVAALVDGGEPTRGGSRHPTAVEAVEASGE